MEPVQHAEDQRRGEDTEHGHQRIDALQGAAEAFGKELRADVRLRDPAFDPRVARPVRIVGELTLEAESGHAGTDDEEDPGAEEVHLERTEVAAAASGDERRGQLSRA